MRQRIDGAGLFFAWFAVIAWVLVAGAGTAMALGEDEAIVGVIGVSPAAVFLTVAAVVLRRQDRSLGST